VGMQRMSYVPFRQARSVILQSEMDIQAGYILSSISYQAVKSLTIISDSATSLPAINIVDTIPQLTSLNLSIKKLPINMTIAGYLPPALEELHIRHELRATFPPISTGIRLLKLQTLGLSYGSMGLVEAVSMVKLRTLILYGSSNLEELHQVQLNDNADHNYRRVTKLEFREWSVVDAGSTNTGAVSLLHKLVSKMTALRLIKFIDSFIDGEHLVSVVDEALRRNSGGSLKALKEVTFSRVSGITRSQCDDMVNLVPKLNIYV
jgi:hypothetical protein